MTTFWQIFWRRASLPLMALAGHVGLAGCDDVTVHAPVGPQRFSDSDFPYAARNGEIKTEIIGNPFNDDPGFAAIVTETMHNANRGQPVRFALEPERGGSAPYHVVMVFNAPRNMTADQACTRPAPPAATRGSQPVSLLAVFCNGDTALSQASGTVGGATSADDRKFRSLVRQVTHALIPAYDFKGPG